ncbi:MAG TPA: hypothetical protein VGX78_22220 [Pirellulales bacterium]|nr:hypothetical protein [Pirellulales bacterium]
MRSGLKAGDAAAEKTSAELLAAAGGFAEVDPEDKFLIVRKMQAPDTSWA